MKKLLFSLALLMGMASLGNAVLNACGAKFLVSSRGARYQRLLASIKPTRILIYWKQDENTKKEDRWNPEATKVLGKVGHSVEVAFRSDGLSNRFSVIFFRACREELLHLCFPAGQVQVLPAG